MQITLSIDNSSDDPVRIVDFLQRLQQHFAEYVSSAAPAAVTYPVARGSNAAVAAPVAVPTPAAPAPTTPATESVAHTTDAEPRRKRGRPSIADRMTAIDPPKPLGRAEPATEAPGFFDLPKPATHASAPAAVGFEAVQEAFVKLVSRDDGEEQIAALMRTFQVRRLRDLPTEKYGAFVALATEASLSAAV